DLRDPAGAIGGLIPHARFTTSMILILNFAFFAATMLASMQGRGPVFDIDGYVLLRFGAKYSAAILQDGDWWRLVTAGFLHGGVLHILMNSWALFDLGAQIEEIFGARRLIVFYFVSTVTGFLASTYWSNTLSVGASAAIFGLIGAMIAYGRKSAYGAALRPLYVRWAIYGLVFGLLPGLAIDNAAHVGGLAGGFVCAYFTDEPRAFGSKTETLWRIAAWLCAVTTGACFLLMYLSGSR
ncbi:MAG: rhomboid family intramembrane serine protease, partial [Bryobacteraceae bacterium]